jgi:hypothetical protein
MTIEDIDVSNVDGIFLAAMGKGRRFSDSSLRCQAFMKRMRIKMLEYFNKKKVGCEAVSNFSFDHNRLPPEGDIEVIARAWEIVADLTKRIADSKTDPKTDILDLVKFSKRSLDGAKDGNYISYRFNFTVIADINTLRRLIKSLYDAYEVNRIYAIRDVKLFRIVDRVNEIITESERIKEDSEYDMDSNTDKDRDKAPDKLRGRATPFAAGNTLKQSAKKTKLKKTFNEKRQVLSPKDPGYGKIIIGDNNIIRAEFEVDYIIYNSPNM